MSYSCRIHVHLTYIEDFYSAPCFLHAFVNFYMYPFLHPSHRRPPMTFRHLESRITSLLLVGDVIFTESSSTCICSFFHSFIFEMKLECSSSSRFRLSYRWPAGNWTSYMFKLLVAFTLFSYNSCLYFLHFRMRT